MSLPSRECGLKLRYGSKNIEIAKVTPLAGVWIEMKLWLSNVGNTESLPSRECGLKSATPLFRARLTSHSPRGSVD